MAIELFQVMQAGALNLTAPTVSQLINTGYQKVTAFDTVVKTDTNIIPSVANNNIEITKLGYYFVGINLAWDGGNGQTYDMNVFINGASAIPNAYLSINTLGVNIPVVLNWTTFWPVTSLPFVFDVRLKRQSSSTTVNYFAGNLFAEFRGDL